MPLVEILGSTIKPDSKSHSRLVISGRTAPAVNFALDRTLPGLFRYEYSNWANPGTLVVIPKGVLVAVRPKLQHDYHTNKYRTVVTYAGPTPIWDGTGTNVVDRFDFRPIGVAPQSYFRRFRLAADGTLARDANGYPIPADDLPEGNDFQPTLVTDAYIEVPYIPNPYDVYDVAPTDQAYTGTLADMVPVPSGTVKIKGPKFKWGCVTNHPQDVGTDNELKPGDYVMAGPFGRFVKWAGGDPSLIVGQVLEMELDIPPLGWLEWVTPEVDTDELRRPAGFGPIGTNEPAPASGGYPYNSKYRYPPESRDYLWPDGWKIWNYGIPGLTRGEYASETWRTKVTTMNVTASGTGPYTLTGTVSVQLDDYIVGKVDANSVEAYIDTNEDNVFAAGEKIVDESSDPAGLVGGTVSYNAATNQVTVTLNDTQSATNYAGPSVKVQVRYKVTNLVGLPPYWDYVGSVGAARILLKL